MRDWLASLARSNRPGPDGEIRVGGRVIYILPTKYGLLFLALVLALLTGAINYANNPAFLLTFLLTGVGMATMIQTWRNLQGLRLAVMAGEQAFVGERVGCRLRLLNDRATARPALQLQLADGSAALLDLPGAGQRGVRLDWPARQRGRAPAGRLTVSTRYPLGLMRAWCYVDSGASALVWPRPAEMAGAPQALDGEGLEGDGQRQGADDFVGLRDYHPGDAPGQLYWKAEAGGRGLLTKQFGTGGHEPLWLDWAHWPYLETEARLSRLCREVIDAHRRGRPYGLRLPGAAIGPGRGEAHRRACLDALALFGAPA